MEYNQLKSSAINDIQLGAGILVSEFDPTTGTVDDDDILLVTSGGFSFTDTPEYTDFGEDIDNCPKNTKELKRITSREIKLSGTALNFDDEALKMYMNITSSTSVTKGKKYIPSDTLSQSAFHDIWLLAEKSDGGAVAIKLMNTLNTSGFALQTTDAEKGTSAFELTAHYTMTDKDTVPYEVYILSSTTNAAAG